MILGLIEHDRGRLNDVSLEMLTLGRRVAQSLEMPLAAVLLGTDAEPLSERLRLYGVTTLYVIEHQSLSDYAPAAWGRSVAQLMESVHPAVVMAAGSDRGNEWLAHIAALSDLPMAANCSAVRPGDDFQVTRWRWGGSLLEDARLSGAVKLLTVAPHALQAEPLPAPVEAACLRFTPTLSDADLRVRVTRRVEAGSGRASLAEAHVVVGGGRGVGGAEGFRALEELAELLDGVVGGSRVVTSLGWRPHSDQVGQTGTRIAPDLYIACGISGAIQHLVGCKSAKCILAINTDRDAQMVTKADYAIIGDLHQVIPALTAEIKKARAVNSRA